MSRLTLPESAARVYPAGVGTAVTVGATDTGSVRGECFSVCQIVRIRIRCVLKKFACADSVLGALGFCRDPPEYGRCGFGFGTTVRLWPVIGAYLDFLSLPIWLVL